MMDLVILVEGRKEGRRERGRRRGRRRGRKREGGGGGRGKEEEEEEEEQEEDRKRRRRRRRRRGNEVCNKYLRKNKSRCGFNRGKWRPGCLTIAFSCKSGFHILAQ
jgi:hypothetical protein